MHFEELGPDLLVRLAWDARRREDLSFVDSVVPRQQGIFELFYISIQSLQSLLMLRVQLFFICSVLLLESCDRFIILGNGVLQRSVSASSWAICTECSSSDMSV